MPNNLITENWSAFQYQKGESARRQFKATGYSDAESVRSASPVQKGNTLPLDGRLVAQEPTVSTPDGAASYLVDVQYSPSSNTSGGGTSDLLDRNPTYWSEFGETSEPVDRDIYGNAITNSAGDPFAQQIQRPYIDIVYHYKRYETSFNGPLAIALNYTVNKSNLVLPGFGTLDPGQGLLRMREEGERDKDTEAVLVHYTWRCRAEGWKTRILDKGRRGWMAGPKVDAFFALNAQGKATDPVTDDVLLDGHGQPLKSGLYLVGPGGAASAEFQPGSFAKVVVEATATGVFLRYELYDETDHSALQLRI